MYKIKQSIVGGQGLGTNLAFNEFGNVLVISSLSPLGPPSVPQNLFVTNITTTSFVINWTAVNNATSYRLDVSRNNSFTDLVSGYNNKNINTNSDSVTGLTAGTNYFIRVRSVNSQGLSPYSSILQQITRPLAPTSLSITNITQNSMTINWAAVNSATAYSINIATNPGFVNIIFGTTLTPSFSTSALSPNTLYYIRVFAINAAGEGDPSSVLTQITTTIAPNKPTISNILSTSFQVDWNIVQGAISYRIDIATDEQFTNILSQYNNFSVIGNTIILTGLSPSTTHYARVRAVNVGGSSFNSPNSDAVLTLGPPVAPSSIFTTSVTATSFIANWNVVATATSYRLDVSTLSNFSTRLTGYDNLTVNGTSQSITGLTANTTYYVRVRAVNQFGSSLDSLPLTQLTAPNAPSIPTVSGITATSFTANWVNPGGATSYRLDISTNSAFSSFFGIYNDFVTTNLSQFVTGLNAGTTYHIRVRAANAGGTSSSSPSLSVITIPAAPNVPTATSITTTSFTANWVNPGSATSYRLDVSAFSNFSTRLTGYDNLTVNSTSQSITGLTAGIIYYVRVRAVNANGTSDPSGTLTQITIPIAPNQPTITNAISTSFTASWNSVTGASSYRIDVATNSEFTSGFVNGYNDKIVGNTSDNVTGLSPGTAYYIRVRAINNTTANLVTSANSPNSTQITSLSTPITINITTTSLTVSWGSVINASYRLDVSDVPDFATRLTGYDNLTVNSTSQLITGLTAGIRYYVRVRAVVSTIGTSPSSSPLIQITIPLAPQLTIPNVTETSFTASWNNVTGASEYRVDVARNSDFTDGFVEGYENRFLNTSSTTFNLTGLISTTNHYVRIRAINNQTTTPVTSQNSTGTAQLLPVQFILGVTNDSREIYRINPVDKTSSLYYKFNINASLNGLAFDSIRNQIFIISDWGSNPNLWCLDLESNNLIDLGLITISSGPNIGTILSNLPGLTYRNNNLYALQAFGNRVVKINLTYNNNLPVSKTTTEILFNNMLAPFGAGGDIDIDQNGDLYIVDSQRFSKITNIDTNPIFTDIVNPFFGTSFNGLSFGNHSTFTGLYAQSGTNNTFGQWALINKNNGSITSHNFVTSGFADLSQFKRKTGIVSPGQPIISKVYIENFLVKWDPIFNASYYLIDIARNNTFTDIIPSYNDLPIDGETFSVTGLATGQNYNIRLRTVDINQNISENSPILNYQFIPMSPRFVIESHNSVNNVQLNISWDIVPGASSYRLDISRNKSFTDLLPDYNNRVVNQAGINYMIGFTDLTRYYARVRAVINGVTSPSSNYGTILIGLPRPSISSFTGPLGSTFPTFDPNCAAGFCLFGVGCFGLRFSWGYIPSAIDYRVSASFDNFFTYIHRDSNQTNPYQNIIVNASSQPPTNLLEGPFSVNGCGISRNRADHTVFVRVTARGRLYDPEVDALVDVFSSDGIRSQAL